MKDDSDCPRGSHGVTSGGKLTPSVRRAPQMVLVAGGEGGKGEKKGRERTEEERTGEERTGGYEKWDDLCHPIFRYLDGLRLL